MQRYYFAPGVIDGPHRAHSRWAVVRAILLDIGHSFCRIAGVLAVCAVLGFAAGFGGLLP